MDKQSKVEQASQGRPGLTALTDAELETVRAGGTVNLSSPGQPSWEAEDDAGTEFKLPQQPR